MATEWCWQQGKIGTRDPEDAQGPFPSFNEALRASRMVLGSDVTVTIGRVERPDPAEYSASVETFVSDMNDSALNDPKWDTFEPPGVFELREDPAGGAHDDLATTLVAWIEKWVKPDPRCWRIAGDGQREMVT